MSVMDAVHDIDIEPSSAHTSDVGKSLRAGLAVGALLVVSALARPASAAQQSECDFNPPGFGERCRAELHTNVLAHGAIYSLKVRAGLTYNPSEMFVISSLWVAMPGGGWVEAGYGYGVFTCGAKTTATWYSARYNASGYFEMCPTSVPAPAVGSDHQVKFEKINGDEWLLVIDGTLAWLHVDMKTYGNTLDLGLERNHWATRLNDAWSWSYRYKTTSDVWLNSIWSNTYTTIIGTPSAYGSGTAPYAVFVHGFSGV